MSQFDGLLWKLYQQPDKKMTKEDIIDMELEEDEAEKLTRKFEGHIERSIQQWKIANPNRKESEAPWGKIVRNAMLRCVGGGVAFVAIANLISSLMQLFYIYWTQRIITWIITPNAPIKDGAIDCAVFTVAAFVSSTIMRTSVMKGLIVGTKVRKIFVSAIYDKLGKLSAKSVMSTNSGKLITLVSSDIFMIERGLAFAPLALTAPFINIVVMVVVGV
jgi:ABC-type multidrug transport system fused ATPase/permease subunit